MTRFEKGIAVAGPLIAAGGLWLGIANYKHTVQHDQKQQIDDMLKASTPPPQRALPNINTKQAEKPAEQTDKEPEKPVDQHKPSDSPPVETPKEGPKEEPKPFTFWGYFEAGQGQLRPGILFQVNSCSVGQNLVTCSMEAVSPHYDRTFYFNGTATTITDHEGDQFRVQLNSFAPLQLDRDAAMPFKLDFPVNKDVVKPISVRLNGYDPHSGNIERAAFDIGIKDQH